MTKTLIKNGAVLTQQGWQEPGYVLVDGERIGQVGAGLPSDDIQAQDVIDARYCAVMPGFINGHTHFSQTFMRGLARGLGLLPWLKTLIWPLQAEINPEEFRLAAFLGLVENIKCGVTEVVDHHKVTKSPVYTNHVCEAANEIGLRFTLARSWSDKGKNAEEAGEILADLERLFEQWKDHRWIKIASGPLALWRCSSKTLIAAHEMARRYGSFTHFHVAETRDEVQMSLDEYGKRPVEWLQAIGVLDRGTQIVHAVWVTDHEIELIAKSEAMVIHCPVANAVLGSGIAPVTKMLAQGIPIRLGTDGPASNDDQDILEAAKTAVNLARVSNLDPMVLPPQQALGLLLGKRVLSPGMPADLIIINLNHARAVPVHDIDSAIILSSHGSDVDTVMVNGKILMRDKKVLVLDEDELLLECRTAIKGLRARAGID